MATKPIQLSVSMTGEHATNLTALATKFDLNRNQVVRKGIAALANLDRELAEPGSVLFVRLPDGTEKPIRSPL